MNQPILQVQKVAKSFDKQASPALHDVSFELAKGQVMALIGSSGSGKTTLLRMVAGLLTVDQGQILLEGKRVLGPNEQLVAGHPNIRLLAQNFDLAPKMKAHENLRFFLLKWPKARQQARVEELLALCGLSGMEDRYPRELSGGQQQRLALGRALADYPSLLLLDEPFSHLDSQLRHTLRDNLQLLLSQTQTASLVVTHDAQDALYMANQAAVLQEGELIQQGTPQQLYKHPKNTYVAQFFGRPNIISAEVIRQWPGAPAYPPTCFCCIREWDIAMSNSGIPAKVLKKTFLTGYYEVLLDIQGQPLHMNTAHFALSPGDQMNIDIDWKKCQLLLEEKGI